MSAESEAAQKTADANGQTPAPKPAKPERSSGAKPTKRRRRKGKHPAPARAAAPANDQNGDAEESGGKRRQLVRPYPQRTLQDALQIALNIKTINNGNPMATDDVAQSLNLSKKGTHFFYLAASSRDFGLTIGSRDTERLELGDLGRDIVFAKDQQSEKDSKTKAFFSIDIFKRVFDHYGSGKLPEEKQYVSNTLQRDFNLVPELHEEFIGLYEKNCAYLGITNDYKAPKAAADRRADDAGEVRVIGEAPGKFDRTAFVIMPFVEKGETARPAGFFDEVLRTLITPAGNGAGFAVATAEQKGSDVIQSTIINHLLSADLVIADLTDHNPNVLFELGIRIAIEKPVALIRAEGTGRIFDVDSLMRVMSYSANLWASTIERDRPLLADHIKAAWDNRTTYRNYMQILTSKALPVKAAG